MNANHFRSVNSKIFCGGYTRKKPLKKFFCDSVLKKGVKRKMGRVPIDDMKLCIQEWFAQETDLVGLTSLYVEVRMEIDKLLQYMTNSIGKSMAENGLFDKWEG